MKPILLSIVMACAASLSACTQHAPEAPPVGHVQTPPPQPPQPNWFERTGDATWSAVQQPVKWVTAKPAPKTAEVQSVYEAPEAIIVPRDGGLIMIPQEANAPANAAAATTAPASQPKPATP